MSGKAMLWVTAAEGFVAISGLLVGYVRGYKNRHLPMKEVTIKLLRRAGLLYLWSIIGTVGYVAITWYVPLQGGYPYTPMPNGDWAELLAQTVTLRYTYVWVHFLALYAIFLAFSPIAVWLLRRNLAWVVGVTSLGLLALGWLVNSEALQWQFLFFIPSIIGYYLEPIQKWWRSLNRNKQLRIAATTVGLTAVTIATSVIFTYFEPATVAFGAYINDLLFGKDSMSLLRALTAFLWFTGYLFVFYKYRRSIRYGLSWLLIPFGTRSLTAYILHGVSLCIISFFTVQSGNVWVNTILGVISVLIVWGLIKIPFVRKVVPA
jgi:hypothetical protein